MLLGPISVFLIQTPTFGAMIGRQLFYLDAEQTRVLIG